MFRFIHAADIHLGAPNQPPEYQELALPRLISDARSLKTEHIIIAGDTFDKPNPSQRTKDFLLSQVLTCPDINFYFTIGNHDYTTKSKEYHSLVTLSLLKNHAPNIHVCREGKTVFDDFILYVIPEDWSSTEQLEKEKKPVVAAWHGIVPGLDLRTMDPKGSMDSILKMIDLTFADYIALGDIHKQIQLHERCWYSGALTPKTYTCQEGYLLVELMDDGCIDVHQRDLGLPKRVTVVIDFEEGEDTEDSLVEEVRGALEHKNLIRLKFNTPMSVWSGLNKKKIVDGLSKDFVEVKLVNYPVPEKRLRKNAEKLAKMSVIGDEINFLIKENDYGLDKKKLKSICARYL